MRSRKSKDNVRMHLSYQIPQPNGYTIIISGLDLFTDLWRPDLTASR